MSRFVKPVPVTLTLSNGDTLTVRKRLNQGERQAAFKRMYDTGVNGNPRVETLQVPMAMVTAYLLDWSITDDGKPVVIADKSIDELESILNALDPDDFSEIKNAIDVHVTAMEQAREKEKNSPGGGTESSAISPSRKRSAGAMAGSKNLTLTSTTSSSTN